MTKDLSPKKRVFTQYETFVIAILAIIQFTVILDFMVLSPLGAMLLVELDITTSQFGLVVSAYAFSAGISGLLAAGFADKFDRKKLLLFFYSGFIIGTLLCGIAPNYHFLLAARIVTGVFGGVLGSVVFAIITDLFKLEVRGRVMGFVQMAFASSQVLGLPVGLYVANLWGWHSPFILIVGLAVGTATVIILFMKPVDEHLKLQTPGNPFKKLYKTVSQPVYLKAFGATALLATGGFMLMPFGSTFGVNNLGITLDQLPLVYMLTGISTIMVGPLAGKLSDLYGKYKIFTIGTFIGIATILIYCNLGITPLWIVIIINIAIFIGITARMISASALMTAIPEPRERGAFMGVNSSIQQVSGGFASALAGIIVIQTPAGPLERYDLLGYVVTGTMLVTILMMSVINKIVKDKVKKQMQPV
ncbi:MULTISPECIES: MFS transporter [unclassified Imperialibacter]|uniref:MFS transporter n=1 Tax=unclassified Imperialibacter TaxID=2629706 RepID=UPI00125C4670|nr:MULTISPECIES: MFS transporter [unclassified Imperialibacter]CAD5280728.1 MFS transporter [Imperialibacter sp. 75]CAD5284404.1 MFS transporter [Imperialibacter sp. 89]VVT28397.1 MFS transporter [Imperialibacter sp. EC-SDR9]